MNTKTDWGKLQNLQKTFKRGATVISEGTSPNALYVLMSGRLNVLKEGILISQIKKRGEYIGEIAVLLNIAASATVKAETECALIEIETSKIIPFLHHAPEIAIALARKMAERLVELNANFSQLVDKAYRPDFVKRLQDRPKQNPSIKPEYEINLDKLKSLFVEYAEGMDVLTQGQYPRALYILVSGRLDIVKNGKVIAVEDKPGYYLGDVAVLRNTFSNATVTTRTKCTLIEIGIEKVEAFLNHKPDVAISIAVKLAERTLAINELFLDLQMDAVREYKKKEEQLKKEAMSKNKPLTTSYNSYKLPDFQKVDAISSEIEKLQKEGREIYTMLGIEYIE